MVRTFCEVKLKNIITIYISVFIYLSITIFRFEFELSVSINKLTERVHPLKIEITISFVKYL